MTEINDEKLRKESIASSLRGMAAAAKAVMSDAKFIGGGDCEIIMLHLVKHAGEDEHEICIGSSLPIEVAKSTVIGIASAYALEEVAALKAAAETVKQDLGVADVSDA